MVYCKWLRVVSGCFYVSVMLLYIFVSFGPNFIKTCVGFIVNLCFRLNQRRRGRGIRSMSINNLVSFMLRYGTYMHTHAYCMCVGGCIFRMCANV